MSTYIRPGGEDQDEVPDFEAIYEPHVDGEGWQMTPRMGWRLWHAALCLADDWDVSILESLEQLVPIVARPFVHDPVWCDQFGDSFRRIAGRLASAAGLTALLAQCTADELALHHTIDLAESHVTDGVPRPAWTDRLPDHAEADVDFGWMREVLFEDHDVLMLFNPALDGIENDFSGAAYLHPRDWFVPFR